MGDLWIGMYNFKIFPYCGFLTFAYTYFHSYLSLLIFKNTNLTLKVSLHLRQKYFSSRWKNPSLGKVKG